MTSLTTQRTCICTLEVTKRHRRAANEMNAERIHAKIYECMKETWSSVKAFDVREMSKNST